MNLIFFVGSLKCANYRERLIRRRRISGRHVPRVPRAEGNGVQKKLELGRRLLELRSKFRWGNEFGRQRRRLFDVDTLTACELMKVTRMYGGRPEIWQRLSWQALVQLSSPSLPAKHREEFERRIIAGEGVKGPEIARLDASGG
jgi:hypothetical protein